MTIQNKLKTPELESTAWYKRYSPLGKINTGVTAVSTKGRWNMVKKPVYHPSSTLEHKCVKDRQTKIREVCVFMCVSCLQDWSWGSHYPIAAGVQMTECPCYWLRWHPIAVYFLACWALKLKLNSLRWIVEFHFHSLKLDRLCLLLCCRGVITFRQDG